MARVLLPDIAVIDEALPSALAGAILDHALASEAAFRPATIAGTNRVIDPEARSALRCETGLGHCAGAFRALMENRFGELCASCGVTPFDFEQIEIELAAHRDGDFYRQHIDAQREGKGLARAARMLSCVLYLNRLPQGYTGGELRIGALAGEAERRVAPRHNRMVAFASFAPHEVLPVSIPGNAFADARFSVNCWFRKTDG